MITFKARGVDVSSTQRGNGRTCVYVKLDLDETDKAEIFYDLWTENGDDWLAELIKSEGYQFGKKEQKS